MSHLGHFLLLIDANDAIIILIILQHTEPLPQGLDARRTMQKNTGEEA